MNVSSKAPVARFAAWGALGFGLGGVLCGLVQAALNHPASQIAARDSLIATLGFGIMGMLGGATLGFAARSVRAVNRFALAGLVGFGAGGLLNLLLVYAAARDLTALAPVFGVVAAPEAEAVDLRIYTFIALMYAIAFLTRGVIGGAVLGVAVPSRHAVRFLSLMGGLGFGIGGIAGWAVVNQPWLEVAHLGVYAVYVLWLTTSTLIGGAVLGAGVGLLSRSLSRL
jgi:hypothetical protein